MSQTTPALPALSHRLRDALRGARRPRGPEAPEPVKRWGIELRRFAGPSAFCEGLSRLRVAHLTDIHVGRMTPLEMQKAAVAMTNAEKPDLVVVTGDFVCHSTRYLDQLTELVSGFDAPCVGVLGNHDYWSGAGEVKMALERGGMLVLENQNTTITLRGQRLQLVGLDDAYTGHADREKALRGLRPDVPSLGLSHIGEEADGLWARGVPLVLAGHTHAGQITVAKIHEIGLGKLAGHKYIHGLYGTRRASEAPHGALYVGAGLGAAVMPFRVGDRGKREVAIFELGAEPGSLVEHHAEQAPLPGRKPTPELVERRKQAAARKAARRRAKMA